MNVAEELNYNSEFNIELTPEQVALHELYVEMMRRGYEEMGEINKRLANNEAPPNGIW